MKGLDSTDASGIKRNRDPMVVRLRRTSGATPDEGIYWCNANDTTEILQSICWTVQQWRTYLHTASLLCLT